MLVQERMETTRVSPHPPPSFNPPVHTTLERFQNAALYLQLSLPSTPIRRVNGAFRKRSSNGRNLKTPGFRFLVDGKQGENGAF